MNAVSEPRPIRILYMEDDPGLARLVQKRLERAGYAVALARDGEEGLSMYAAGEYDVVAVDQAMPVYDGLQVIRILASRGPLPPTIMITGAGDERVAVEAMKLGASDYIVKDVDGGYLDLLPAVIERGRQQQRLVEEKRQADEALRELNATLEAQVVARTAEIQAEREKSEAILRSVGDAIVMFDVEGRIQYVNSAFTTLTGYTAEEVLGQRAGSLTGGEMSERVGQSLQLALAKGEVWQGEATLRRKDGRTYDATITATPMRDASGNLVGHVSSHQDISRLKDLERSRVRFITNISHQLRTPVTTIQLYMHLLRGGKRPEKAGDYFRAVEEEVTRLISLIQDIVEVTVLDSGQAVAVWKPVSLSTVIEDAVKRYRAEAKAANLTLEVAPLPPDLPVVKGDQARLLQALGEIVENAVIFTPGGGRVSVGVETVEYKAQSWVTITVRDTGPGILPEEQKQVFERFYRGSLAESGHIPGTGLGLSIADDILRAHGGRVTLESKVGAGSAFTLWLRVAR